MMYNATNFQHMCDVMVHMIRAIHHLRGMQSDPQWPMYVMQTRAMLRWDLIRIQEDIAKIVWC